ncbi:hypothetical protein G6045_22395 [Streptomyces sp. YC504]|uniref:Uncharacterized protein n=1 Tax=Streptomyces mesophilus TaxID=1775132 RepID=A0A6G4XLT6_9ACTN|nr:hypothetical protein [Streptomyces mesophilus]NGO78388.1 hypothetical protein [Streptomyces mesophilus]
MVQLDEQDLTRVMGEVVGGVRPSTHALVEEGERRGRRIKARRRAGYSTAACVLAGVVAGTSWLGTQQSTPGEQMRILPGMSAGGPGKVTIPDFSGAPTDTGTPPGKERATARTLARTLQEGLMLPLIWDVQGYQGEVAPRSHYEAIAALRVGAGDTHFTVGVTLHSQFHLTPHVERSYSCDALKDPNQTVFAGGGKVTTCGVRNLPDGSVLRLYEFQQGHQVTPHADLLRRDGMRISAGVSIASGPESGGRAIPVTLREVEQIVTKDRWQVYVDPEVNERAKSLKPFEELHGIADLIARNETD